MQCEINNLCAVKKISVVDDLKYSQKVVLLVHEER